MIKTISIITPLYNGAKTLGETSESVLAQDFDNWEWILFDDGSTDDTIVIAEKLCEANPERVRLFRHEGNANFGTSFTRNKAVEMASADIIAFIDQDDVWYKNRLSHQMEIFSQHPECAMIWSPALYWYENREFVQPVGYRGRGLKKGAYQPPEFVRIFLSDLRGTPLPSGSLVRRKAFESVNGYEESIRGSEDVVLWLKLAAKYPIYFDDKVLIKYRKHHDSTLRVARRSGKMDEWDLVFYRWVHNFLNETGADDQLKMENDFAFYKTLKRIAAREGYFKSRSVLKKRMSEYPDINSKFALDYLLDLVLPFDIANKVSAKLRFDMLAKS